MNLREYIAALQAIADANPATLEIPVCERIPFTRPEMQEVLTLPIVTNGIYGDSASTMRTLTRGAYIEIGHR